MPLIEQSTYVAPFGFRNGHLQTIYPALFRKVPLVTTEPERIETPDDDFIDLMWAHTPNATRLAVLTHGLEGSAQATYVQGMARALVQDGWSVLTWNFRNCSHEPNRQLRSYHSGAIDDLETVLAHTARHTQIKAIALLGFSLGGNLTLKYLGDHGGQIDPRIRAAVAISVPCDLAGSSERLEHWSNRIYMARFLRTLRSKVREKMTRHPGKIHDHGLDQMRTFREFDGAYTAPIHGFTSADHYWSECSCTKGLLNITVPTLLINAQNDPFLTPSCFPIEEAQNSRHFYLEMPTHGGHMGFIQRQNGAAYWSENRAVAFLQAATTARA
ncbi:MULTISPECIES: YheT family hydrolase [unclassified Lentimonas]|uniref:YheT family hydrolase n=1 Tax=unclassified Lentimonas TaxID=2630993 RepID=UPI001325709C|nr:MULTISPECIES: alpha/beta fold hydrolase [unclassified Lentimonas]CAA6696420.1 Hydrolase, alpha/beta fold family functionally coupled to Phosphoribulokinase [Lentimonas sp. CC10]CAA6697669.1 Hydrolase, alpha/beta fold family functionally coupled to Phosphoribulokinase [Lentimonas sp. CC19]CAA7071492.1 Hydrolase, alpha/beta fold family functionally coupled to Phosphoribulokinase [Lentimonas sp. CC11]